MPYAKMTLYAAVLCGVSGILVSILFNGCQQSKKIGQLQHLSAASRQVQQTAGSEHATPAHAIVVSPVLPKRNPVMQRKPDPIMQLEKALQSKDEHAIRAAVTKMDGCSDCLMRLSGFFENPLRDVAERIALGRALIRAGTQAGTLLVVNAILHASFTEESDSKDGLLQGLADAQTPETTAALIDVITDEVVDLNFQELPADLQYAIQKAIRLNPDGEKSGQMLVDSYHHASPEIAQRLEGVQHPTMVALLAKEAYASGDMARTDQLTDLLSSMDDPRVLESMMLLGQENVIPLEEATAGRIPGPRNMVTQPIRVAMPPI